MRKRQKYKDEKGEEGPFEPKSSQIPSLNRITPDQTDSMEISETPIPVQSPVLGTYWGDKGSTFFPKIISYLNKI